MLPSVALVYARKCCVILKNAGAVKIYTEKDLALSSKYATLKLLLSLSLNIFILLSPPLSLSLSLFSKFGQL